MDNISDLLKNRKISEPDDVKIIKDFIKNKFNESCSLKISKDKITIIVGNSSLAGALRENITDLRKDINLEKSISIVIGKV